MSSYTLRLILLAEVFFCFCTSSLWGQNKNAPDSTVQVQSNGDTIITYSQSAYDFGALYTAPPNGSGVSPQSLGVERRQGNTLNFGPGRLTLSSDVCPKAWTEAIPYSTGITATGGLSYTIPITVGPLVQLTSSLSLTYNSQAGDGVAGYGWSLGGLSSILPVNKTTLFDGMYGSPAGNSHPLEWTALSLDGVRLVRNTLNALEADYHYVTERGEILASVLGKGYEVRYPNGLTGIYSLSASEPQTYGAPMSRLVDHLGNSATYVYDRVSGVDYIRRIVFHRIGGACGGAEGDRVEFVYEDRGTATEGYAYGRPISLRKLLKAVVVYSRGVELLRYTLTHERYDGRYYLKQIDCSSQGTHLNPLRCFYEWQREEHASTGAHLEKYRAFQLSSSFNMDPNKVVIQRGRLHRGEGNDGMILYPNMERYGVTRRCRYKVLKRVIGETREYGGIYPENQDLLVAPSLMGWSSVHLLKAGKGFQELRAVDVDGDGLDELVKLNLEGTVRKIRPGVFYEVFTQLRITVYHLVEDWSQTLSGAKSFVVEIPGCVSNQDFVSPIDLCYYWGAFLGDGRVQLLVVSPNKNRDGVDIRSTFTLVDLQAGQGLLQQELFDFDRSDGPSIHILDIDGDGRSDLCRVHQGSMTCYSVGGSSSAFELLSSWGSGGSSSFTSSSSVYWCDLNGDGLLDAFVPVGISSWVGGSTDTPPTIPSDTILTKPTPWDGAVYDDKGDLWHFYINTGSGFKLHTRPLFARGAPEEELTTEFADEILPLDVNQDGLADLVYITLRGILVYLNKDGWISNQQSAYLSSEFIHPIPMSLVRRDQMVSLACIDRSGVCTSYTFSESRQRQGLLTAFVDSRGVEQRYVHKPLRGTGTGYRNPVYRETKNPVPEGMIRIQPSWYLLQGQYSYLPDERGTEVEAKEYYYEDVTMNHVWGFCGFKTTKALDLKSDTEQVTVYSPELRGVPISTEMRLAGDTGLSPIETTRMTYAWPKQYDDNYRWDNRLVSVHTEHLLTGVITDRELTYDYPGYITEERVTSRLKDADPSHTTTTTTTTTYQHSLTPELYLLGQARAVCVSQTIYGQPAVETITETQLDKYLRPLSSMTKRGGVQISHSRCSYDDRGHVLTTASAPYEVTQLRGTSYTYDAEGYPTSVTDALGRRTESSDYDPWGHARVTIDMLGMRTQTEYDCWGRALWVKKPDGTKSGVRYEQKSQGRYMQITEATGQPTSYREYDAAGRVLREGAELPDGTTLWTVTEYDERGRVSHVSLPYRGSTPTDWSTYAYDMYNRPTVYREPSGRETTWHYEGNETTETRGGVSITRAKNEVGNLLWAKDAGGRTDYEYNQFGSVRSIWLSGGGRTTFEYDVVGRQIALNDPSTGRRETSYHYAPDGTYTERHTSPKGSVTTVSDPYGRVQRVEREGTFTTTYSYDGYDRVTEEHSTNGSFRHYTYDALGRIETQEEGVAPSKILKRTYGYDRDGRVASLTYRTPESEEFTELYSYAHGHHMMTRLQSPLRPTIDTIWRLLAVNNMGIPTEASTGGQRRTYSYSPQGLLTGRTMGDAQRETYEFDPHTGNLSLRTWMVRDTVRTQSFDYDRLNRLNKWSGGGFCIYDPNGNLIRTGDELSGGCNFLYEDGAHPYRLTEVNSYEGKGFHPVKPDPQPDPQPVPFSGNPFIRIKDLIPPSLQTEVEQTLTYTSFDRPESITQGSYRAVWDYNSALDRIWMRLTRGDTLQREVYYWGNQYEEEHRPQSGERTARLYLEGDAYSAPAVLVKERGGWHLYYIARDYLGSITDIVASDGTRRAHYHYSPWGRVEEGQEEPLFLGRGFTGHEHLPEFDLIQMNARLYDPYTGRFLSPDPYVQLPDFSQSFNRYSYCLNNPLRYVDKDGKIFWLVPVAMGALAGMTSLGIQAHLGNVHNFGDALFYFGLGAASGALGTLAGGAVAGLAGGTGFWAGAAGGAAGGFVGGFLSGTGAALYQGNDFGTSLAVGTVNGAASGLIGGVIGGTISGLQSALNGGNFWTGKLRDVTLFDISKGGTTPGHVPVPEELRNDAGVEKLMKEWYPGAPYDKIDVISIDNVPLDEMARLREKDAAGLTRALLDKFKKLTGHSKIFYNDPVRHELWEYMDNLYKTAGHELVHATQIAQLRGVSLDVYKQLTKLMEYHAHSFSVVLGRKMPAELIGYRVPSKIAGYSPMLDYRNYPWAATHTRLYFVVP